MNKPERDDNVYNPRYRQEKKFMRKETKTHIIRITMITLTILFLGSKYFESKVIGIDIYTTNWEKIDYCVVDGVANFYLKNNSPYRLKLVFNSEYDFDTNYNDTDILYPDISTFIWFKSDIRQTIRITGERI